MKLLLIFHTVLLTLLLLWQPVFGAVSDPASVDDQDQAVFSRVSAHFANIPDYQPSCPDLEMPNKVPIYGLFLSKDEDQSIDDAFGRFKGLDIQVDQKRQAARESAEAMIDAALTYYRAKDQGYVGWKKAELDFQYALYVWLWHLWDLDRSEQELRKITSEYYTTWSKAFVQVGRQDQEKVLEAFDKRAVCLQKARRTTFDALQKARRELWELTRSSNLNVLDNTGLTLKLTNLEQAYAWLVPEQAAHKAIYAKLLDAFDQSVRNRDLFPELLQAYLENPYLRYDDAIPATPANHQIRLRILRARARKALLALHLQDIKIEAAYSGQLSMTAGFRTGFANISDAGKKAIDDIWTSAELTAKGKFNGLGPQVQALAILGGAYKFLGSSLSMLVTTPMKDAFTEAVFKPLGSTVGLDIKNSMESAFALYKQQRRELDVRLKLLENISTQTSEFTQGTDFVRDVQAGGGLAGGKSIAGRAPMTTRALLEDGDFIDESGGGLQWVFEIACQSPRERAAFLLQGARYEMAGRLRAAHARIAANRGVAVDNPDQMVNKAVLQELTDPGSKSPSGFQEFMVANTDQFLQIFPGVKGIQAAYKLLPQFKNTLQTIVGNIPDQDAYLKLQLRLQERLDLLLSGLAEHDYNFSTLQAKRWNLYRHHFNLLNNSFEYATAYRLCRTAEWERDKLFHYVTHRGPSGQISSEGQGLLAAIEAGQKMDYTDLGSRASFLKLQYHALSVDYKNAAMETRLLQAAENQRRQAFKLPGKVDLSGIAKEFEGQAALQNLIGIYEELYYKAVEDVLTDVVTAKMSSLFASSLTTKLSLQSIAESAGNDVSAKLIQAVNPWVGKFSISGVFDVLEGGAIDALTTTTSQTLAKQQTLFSEQEIDKAAGLLINFTKDVAKASLPHVVKEGAIKWYSGEAEYAARVTEALALRNATSDAYAADFRLAEELMQKAKTGDLDSADNAMQRLVARTDFALLKERRRRALAMGELEDAAEVRRQIEDEIDTAVELIQAEAVKAKSRSIARGGEDDADESARLHALEEYKALLKTKVPTIDDLRRLTAEDDPLELRKIVLTEAFDIKDVREGLKKARTSAKKNNDEESVQQINELAKEIDRIRIGKVEELLDGFFAREPDLARLVISVIQVGAAEGNPEHQGIFGDIDFTVFTKNGVDGKKLQEIKAKLQAYFESNGYPLATQERNGHSPLDTETFVQHWSPFDTAGTAFGEAMVNVAANMADPTRFPSYAGGIWANNNAAYSGKKLWGNGPKRPDFIELKKHHANDLTIDMAKFMGFIVDPKYRGAHLDELGSFESRKKHLAKGLSKAKAGLRMFDALLISDDEGNKTYNSRIERRRDEGEDASYHLQIYKELRRLHNEGKMKVLSPEDLDAVEQLARMKMKGDHPEVWDVLGNDQAGLQAAQHLIDRLRDLAPKVIALTAENQHQELERVAREGTETERKVVAVDIYRQASTLLKTAKDTPFGVLTSLMIPKASYNTDSGQWNVMSREDHEQRIRQAITENARTMEEIHIRDELEKAVQNRSANDLLGEATKQQIQQIIAQRPSIGSVQLEEEDANLRWFQDAQRKVRHLRQGIPLN